MAPGQGAALAAPAVGRGTSRLSEAAPRRPEELRDFERRRARVLRDNGDSYRIDLERWTSSPESAAAASLAMDLVEARSLPEIVVALILTDTHGDQLGNHAHDALTVVSHLAPQLAEDPADWYTLAVMALARLRLHDLSGPRLIQTREDLVSAAALVEFMVGADGRHWSVERTPPPHGMLAIQLTNAHLTQLLRQRPCDVGRIIEYANERGIDDSDPVDELLEWLDSSTGALGAGWL